MCDRSGEFLEPPLAVENLATEQVLMVAVERFPLEIFVGTVSKGHSSARQDILDPPAQARLFTLGRLQRIFDAFQNGADA